MKVAQGIAKEQNMKSSKVMPGELILVVPFSTSKGTYEINLATETGLTNIPLERRLEFRNNFIISAMALGALKVPVVNGVTQWGATLPVFHEDATIFNTAAGAAATSESQQIAGLWMGKFSLQNNEEQKIIDFPTRGFRTVYQTQQGGVTDGTLAFPTVNQQDGNEYKSLGGIVKLAGGNQNKIILNIQTEDKTHLAGTAAAPNYIYIALRGAYLRGGTISELQK